MPHRQGSVPFITYLTMAIDTHTPTAKSIIGRKGLAWYFILRQWRYNHTLICISYFPHYNIRPCIDYSCCNPAQLRSLSCYFAACFYRSHESFIKSCVTSFSLKLVAVALCSTFVLCSGMLFKGLRRSWLDENNCRKPSKALSPQTQLK